MDDDRPRPPEAPIEQSEHGRRPAGAGWFVVNARDAVWARREGSGRWWDPEPGDAPFPHLGVNVYVLEPGERNALYHGEVGQEDFLVLSGECLLLVEGEERALRRWDLVHCPPWTRHVFVGAGDGPCAILMIGARIEPDEVLYPADPVAARHRASARETTSSPEEAYGPRRAPDLLPYREGDLG